MTFQTFQSQKLQDRIWQQHMAACKLQIWLNVSRIFECSLLQPVNLPKMQKSWIPGKIRWEMKDFTSFPFGVLLIISIQIQISHLLPDTKDTSVWTVEGKQVLAASSQARSSASRVVPHPSLLSCCQKWSCKPWAAADYGIRQSNAV